MFNMKLPLSLIIVIVWFLAVITYSSFKAFDENVDSNIKEIGSTIFYDTELKAWKAGDCYVFGIHQVSKDGQNSGMPPAFFSNCQQR